MAALELVFVDGADRMAVAADERAPAGENAPGHEAADLRIVRPGAWLRIRQLARPHLIPILIEAGQRPIPLTPSPLRTARHRLSPASDCAALAAPALCHSGWVYNANAIHKQKATPATPSSR